MTNHGEKPIRGGRRHVPQSPIHEGRFGRMFRRLPPAPRLDDDQIAALAATMHEIAPPPAGGWGAAPQPQPGGDNETIPAIYTYFGQFLDHDLTFDPASSLQQQNDPDAIVNFRSPRFDLDSLYGSGPVDEPFHYRKAEPPDAPTHFLIGSNGTDEDLPRNTEGVALIGDPRNDENVVLSQLQLLFLKFHNRIADEVAADASVPAEQRFEETQRRVRWTYQQVVVFDYVKRIIGDETFDGILDVEPNGVIDIKRRHYRPRNNAYMPIEFSAAAFRFGHSQVRGVYDLSAAVTGRPIFVPGQAGEFDDLRGNRPLPEGWTIDWSHFIDLGTDTSVQPSRLIDTRLAEGLFALPGMGGSLPERNLHTGQRLELPSGQDVARAMCIDPLTDAELAGAPAPTPLWFYLLKEAEVRAAGQHLGPAGGRIVGEVLLGMLEMDKLSWVNVDPTWKTPVPVFGDWPTLSDIVRYVTAN